MAALTDYSETLVLTYLFTTSSASRPTSWFVALHTADPGESGTANEVTTGLDANYARKSVSFSDPASNSGQIATNAAVSWTVAASSPGYTVTHISIWTSSTGGSCLVKGSLVAPAVLSGSQTLSFASGNIIISLD